MSDSPAKAPTGSLKSAFKKFLKLKKSGSGREGESGNIHSTNQEPTTATSKEPPPDAESIPFTSSAEPQVEGTATAIIEPTPPAAAVPSCDDQLQLPQSYDDASQPSNGSTIGPTNQPIEPTAEDIVMVVMGPTGVGKTTFIDSFNKDYESKPFQLDHVGHHELTAGTKDVRVVRFILEESGANLVLVDTPGFDDAARPDSEVLMCIAKHLEETYRKKDFLHGIIYLHRITDVRFDAGAAAALNIFKKLYGSSGYDKLALVTTMWNDIKPEMKYKYEEKEEELKGNAWAAFLKRDKPALVARYDSTNDEVRRATALQVVTQLMRKNLTEVSKSNLDTIKLRIQVELVDEGKSLPRTEAGRAAFTLAETARYYLREISNS